MNPPQALNPQEPAGPLCFLAPQLFLVVLGGRVSGARIELHDVRFVVGHALEETWPDLRRQWFGERRGLHIDSWMVVRQVGAFAVELRRDPQEGPERLWFVNLGGYRADRLSEAHAFGLVVAATAAKAKRQALATWLLDAEQRHKDDVHPIDTVAGWRVHLRPVADSPSPQRPDWYGYQPI
jgi:hypothetical protein